MRFKKWLYHLDSSFPSSLIQLRSANSLYMQRLILMYFMEIHKLSYCWEQITETISKAKKFNLLASDDENNKIIAKNMKP
jgi:hypothetical protein